jgi:hypothetical protein
LLLIRVRVRSVKVLLAEIRRVIGIVQMPCCGFDITEIATSIPDGEQGVCFPLTSFTLFWPTHPRPDTHRRALTDGDSTSVDYAFSNSLGVTRCRATPRDNLCNVSIIEVESSVVLIITVWGG